MTWLTWIELQLIGIYRRFLSPMLGPRCRYHPTCSRYAALALKKYGFLRGNMKVLGRLVRCAPWGAGGDDPP